MSGNFLHACLNRSHLYPFNNMKMMKHAATITLLIANFSSCVPARRGYYFYDLKETKNNIDSAQLEASRRIQPGDRLVINIVVEDHEGNQLLNAGMLGAGGTQQTATASSGFGYLVDNNGKIAIPRLGEIYVKGQTPQEVGEIIKQRTAILYKDPVVYCNLSGRIVIIRGNGVGGVIPITGSQYWRPWGKREISILLPEGTKFGLYGKKTGSVYIVK